MPEIIEGYKRYKYEKKTKKVRKTSSKLQESLDTMKAYEVKRTTVQRDLDTETKSLKQKKDNKVKAKSFIEELEKEKNNFVDERNILLNGLAAAKSSPNAKHIKQEINRKIKALERAHTDKTRKFLNKLSGLQLDTLPNNLARIINGDVIDKFNVESISRLKKELEKPSLAEKTHNEIMEHHKLLLEAINKKIQKHAKKLELNKEQYSELGKFDNYMKKIRQKALENSVKESEKRTKKLFKNATNATIEIRKSKEEMISEAYDHFNENSNATVEDFMTLVTAESVGMKPDSSEFEKFIRALELRVTYVSESVKLTLTKNAAIDIRSESEARVAASGAIKTLNASNSETATSDPNARHDIAAKVAKFVNAVNEHEEGTVKKPLTQEDIRNIVTSSKSELARILQSFGVRNSLLKDANAAGKVAVDRLAFALQNTIELLSRDFKKFKQTPEYSQFIENISKTELKSFNSLQEYMKVMIGSIKDNPNINIDAFTKIVSELIRNAALLHLPKVESGIKSILELFKELPPEPVKEPVPEIFPEHKPLFDKLNAEITRFTNDEYQAKLNEIEKLEKKNPYDTRLYALKETAKNNKHKLDAFNLINEDILANNAKINEERAKLKSTTDRNEQAAINKRITQYSLNIKRHKGDLALFLTKAGENRDLTTEQNNSNREYYNKNLELYSKLSKNESELLKNRDEMQAAIAALKKRDTSESKEQLLELEKLGKELDAKIKKISDDKQKSMNSTRSLITEKDDTKRKDLIDEIDFTYYGKPNSLEKPTKDFDTLMEELNKTSQRSKDILKSKIDVDEYKNVLTPKLKELEAAKRESDKLDFQIKAVFEESKKTDSYKSLIAQKEIYDRAFAKMNADIKAYNQEVIKNLIKNNSGFRLNDYRNAYYKLRYPSEFNESPGGYMNTDF
jgi:hypothetical protein